MIFIGSAVATDHNGRDNMNTTNKVCVTLQMVDGSIKCVWVDRARNAPAVGGTIAKILNIEVVA
jgi:hypothetical protein